MHCDAYRLTSGADVRSIGLDDYLQSKESILCIEWADKIRGTLPKSTQWITLTRVNESTRIVEDDRRQRNG